MAGDAVKIYFCDICNESIPLRDLELGSAISIKGKVICHNCNPQAGSAPAAPVVAGGASPAIPAQAPASYSSQGALFLAGFGILAAVAAIVLVLFFHENTKNEMRAMQDNLQTDIERMDGRLAGFKTELFQGRAQAMNDLKKETNKELEKDRLSGQKQLTLLSDKIEGLQVSLNRFETITRRLDMIEAWSEGTKENLSTIRDEMNNVSTEVRNVKEAVANFSAAPTPVEAEGGKAAAMPIPGWDDMVQRLKDEDPGVRWNAVIDIGKTADPRAVPHLIPLLEDDDVFVRNNVAQTLGELDALEAVPALIEALNDREHFVRDSAYTALKRVTRHNIKFDPWSKSKEERNRAIKAWKKWWEANQEKLQGP